MSGHTFDRWGSGGDVGTTPTDPDPVTGPSGSHSPTDPTLFDVEVYAVPTGPMARASDPETSHDAAAVAMVSASEHRLLAARALIAAGDEGLTDFELAAITNVAQTSIGKRRLELQRGGMVSYQRIAGGPVLTRRAPSGAQAIVWFANVDVLQAWVDAQRLVKHRRHNR